MDNIHRQITYASIFNLNIIKLIKDTVKLNEQDKINVGSLMTYSYNVSKWIIDTKFGDNMKSPLMPNELKGFDKQIKLMMNEIKEILDQNQSNRHTKLLNAK